MASDESSWVFLPHSAYLRDLRWYMKKRPVELAAVHRNLERPMILLARSPSARSVQAGFLHPEPHGMVAIDQRGGLLRLPVIRPSWYSQATICTLTLLWSVGNTAQSGGIHRLYPVAQPSHS